MYKDDFVKEDNFEEIENIKVNDVFFVRALDFYNVGIVDNEYLGTISTLKKTNEEFKKFNDFLFAIKYIGNGMFIEMTTGMELALCDYSDIFEADEYNNMFNFGFWTDFEEYAYRVITRYPRKSEITEALKNNSSDLWNILSEDEKENMFNNYIKDCNKFKNISTVAPLLGLCLQYEDNSGYTEIIKINDESKKIYLKHTDEERKALLEVFRKRAEESYKEACDKIDKKVNELSEILSKRVDTPTSEDLDMAYLENELYDFQKGRSR